MKQIKIKEKEYNLIEGWDEMTLGNYINLVTLQEQKDSFIEEEFLLKFIPLICNVEEEVLTECYEEDLLPFVDLLSNFKIDSFKKEEKRHFNFNNIDYSVVIPSKLTMGENISIKILEKSSNNPFDTWLNLLSILVRPSTSSTDEFGEIIWTPEPFKGDITILRKRKEILLDIPAVNAMWIIEAFTVGRK